MNTYERILTRVRFWIGVFIIGLVLSGVTAFPLVWEINLLARLLQIDPNVPPDVYTGLRFWIAFVRQGVTETDRAYPFMAYGTDWLAFGHLIIALFFVGPLRDPKRNVWCLHVGLIACALVFPLALICGPLRGIPFYWRLIDCSFGILGAVPLLLALRLLSQIKSSDVAKGLQ